MLRPFRKVCLLTLALIPLACGGGGPPPDRATSEAQIRQVVVDYNVFAGQGRGEEACKLTIHQKIDPSLVPDHLRGESDVCAKFWDWLAPRMSPSNRQILLGTQVAAVHIDGDRAIATAIGGGATGGVPIKVRWVDGTWKIDD